MSFVLYIYWSRVRWGVLMWFWRELTIADGLHHNECAGAYYDAYIRFAFDLQLTLPTNYHTQFETSHGYVDQQTRILGRRGSTSSGGAWLKSRFSWSDYHAVSMFSLFDGLVLRELFTRLLKE
jgi:hypothetical protein